MSSNKLTCITVDDEPMALGLVEEYIKKTPFLELQGKFGNAIDALEFLNQTTVDLIFLDIQMPDLSGMELSKLIPKETGIIFTTAFDQYALEGFKVNAIDYLLKPFDYAEFLTAANKARLRLQPSKGHDTPNTPIETLPPQKEFIFVKSEYRQLRIELKNVLYFEGLKDYVKIWMKDTPKPILTLMSLKSLEEELPQEDFMRVHRSYIVSLKNIETIERSQIIINNQRITVSEQYKTKFHDFINKNSL
ncbi:LytTR family DNA-binding domain-containing protein [Mangrovimonas sp. DI 80]|uniref:LytR/AlgR family response regulator transcription factor n=1 Tax=Mangrovimonas sp. DI 80 TaxID=1779330 RepID=UPI0009770FA7|nr:LytTR family DNA-binding domain-containing protein [Mangrovimonas sp. DI 80]OMP30138.1 DNA-binding response regulator [Mangrovimonas sp. DI 80]